VKGGASPPQKSSPVRVHKSMTMSRIGCEQQAEKVAVGGLVEWFGLVDYRDINHRLDEEEPEPRRSVMKAERNQPQGAGRASKGVYRTVNIDGLDIFYRGGCEYPWRNTWQPDYGIYEDDQFGNFSGIRYIRPVARHRWESHLDLSLQSGSSICILNPWIGKKLSLKANLSRPGELVSEFNGETVFVDPTVGISGSPAALITKVQFLEFLKKENLECLWIVAGERNSYPSGQMGDYSVRSFASVYRWTGKKWDWTQVA